MSGARDRLTPITNQLSEIAELADQRRLLDDLTGIWATVEKTAAATAYRFGATRAYYALVRRRIEDWHESRAIQRSVDYLNDRLDYE